ncbi:hypothetical protein DFH27DRAFT_287905 [Peziza echinospora]|nr:hypothetical protein DFH27DRAFT_287905 [Peziza echinospora]
MQFTENVLPAIPLPCLALSLSLPFFALSVHACLLFFTQSHTQSHTHSLSHTFRPLAPRHHGRVGHLAPRSNRTRVEFKQRATIHPSIHPSMHAPSHHTRDPPRARLLPWVPKEVFPGHSAVVEYMSCWSEFLPTLRRGSFGVKCSRHRIN